MLVNPQVLIDEIVKFHADDRTFVDSQCGIIEQTHIDQDIGEDYLKSKVGTTGTGTGRLMRTEHLGGSSLQETFQNCHFTWKMSAIQLTMLYTTMRG